MFTATAQAHFVQFSAGAAVGVFVGLFVGPHLRSWLGWREWVDASQAADSTDPPLTYFANEPAGDSGPMASQESASDGQTGPERPIEPSNSADAAAKRQSPSRRVARPVERRR